MANFARGNPARWWTSRSCGGVSRAPLSQFISPFRRWTSRIFLSFFVLLFAGFWYATNPARISRLSEVLLSKVLGGKVTVQSGRLSLGGTLQLTGIEVRTAEGDPGPAAALPIFSADNIELRFEWLSFLQGQLSATQLVAVRPVFRPIEDPATGHWNYEHLHPPGFASTPRNENESYRPSLPVVVLRDAHVVWSEIRKGHAEKTGETVIEGQMTPDAQEPRLYRFQFSQLAGTSGQMEIGAKLHGTWDSLSNEFSASTQDVQMSDDATDTLRNGLPRAANDWCREHHVAGKLSKVAMKFTPEDGLSVTVAFDDVHMQFMIEPEQGIAMSSERPRYPLELSQVRGEIEFLPNRPSMTVRHLTGLALGFPFMADCQVQGISSDAPYNLHLQFPNTELTENYPPLFMAFLLSQDLLARVEPRGLMDISVDIQRTMPREKSLKINGTVDCRDVEMRFAHFPYPMQHLQGRITFTENSCTFHDVKAKADLADVLITGTTGTTWTNRLIDFTVSSKNAVFDERLAGALPEKYRPIWDLFSINGRGGFVCKVQRDGGLFFDQPRVTVDVDLQDGSGYVKALPYPLTHVAGHLKFETDATHINHLTAVAGKDGSGKIELDGTVHHPSGDVSALLPELTLHADVPIDALLLHTLPEEIGAKLKGVTPAGELVFDGTLRRPDDRNSPDGLGPIQMAGDLAWKHGTLRVADMPGLVLTNIEANGSMSPTLLAVKKLGATLDLAGAGDAARSPVQVSLAGDYHVTDGTGAFTVDATAKGMPVPAKLPGYMPAAWEEKWQAYQPSGAVDLNAHAAVHVSETSEIKDAGSATGMWAGVGVDSYSAAIEAHDVTLKNASWPDPLEKLNGVLNVLPERIAMNQMSGTMGTVSGTWSGRYVPATGAIEITGDAESKGWPVHWLSYLPEAVKSNLDLKRGDVGLSVHMNSLTRAGAGKPWVFDGRVEGTNVAATGPLVMSAGRASFSGKGSILMGSDGVGKDKDNDNDKEKTGGYAFNGVFAATDLRVSEHAIDSLTGTVDASSAEHRIDLTELAGKVAGGDLQGQVLVHTALASAASQPAATTASRPTDWSAGGYEAELLLNDADLARLMLPATATKEDRERVGTGHVYASLSLQETFGPNADRTGRGDLTVSDGNMYNVPLSMGLMQIATLRLPVANSFQQASMTYYLRNDEITFEKILLESKGIDLAGLGTVTIKERGLDLSFITESPNELVIPIFTPMMQEFRNELMQISVTGTLDLPKITPVPLSGIANTLKALLPRPHADARR